MPYIQLDGRQYPLAAGENLVGGSEGARVRLDGAAANGVLAFLDVGADGSTVIRRAGAAVSVNGVALGAEPSPLLHGDKIEIASRELFFGDDRRGGNTQFIPTVRLAEGTPHAAPPKPTAATGGRVISLTDGREYVVPATGLEFGRDPTCDVVVGSTEVSRRHASITPSAQGYQLRDTSTNGVLLNGEPAGSPTLLGRGDVLTIADEEFRFYADSAPPSRPPLAFLEVISSGMLKGTVMEVRTPLAYVGRGAHNDIVIADESVSDTHAKLQRRQDGWYVVDMGSTNGTYVGGRRIDGDAPIVGAPDLRFGGIKFIFRAPDAGNGGTAGQTRAIATFKTELRRAGPGAKTPVVSARGQQAARPVPVKAASRVLPLLLWGGVIVLIVAGLLILLEGF
jgi:pSer/pThr/pTyr-binding forkhead associated (FHA) protein